MVSPSSRAILSLLTQVAAPTNPRRRSARLLDGPPVSYAQVKPYRKPHKPAELWFEALRVHRQRTFRGRQQFLVEWADTDPSSGAAYQHSWLALHKLSEHLRLSWEREKARQTEVATLRRKPVPTPEEQLRLRELEDASAEYFSAPIAGDGSDASSSSGTESPLNEEAAQDEHGSHEDDKEPPARASDDCNDGCSICEDPAQAEDGVLISPCCGKSRSASYACTVDQSGQSMCLHCVSRWKDMPCPFCRARPRQSI
jgi:hypothetical protein